MTPALVTPLIALRGAQRHFRSGTTDIRALTDVTLEITAGEYVALVGRSGSGKSTLLNLISGIDQATGGEVWVDGQPLHTLREPALTLLRRRTFGFVFQAFNLLPTLSVLENIILPGQLEGTPRGRLVERTMSLLSQMGLEHRAGEPPDRLSGGEQQR
ncbi:MAG: ATP-binding cassette domain-containing protein, partial [bacterium]